MCKSARQTLKLNYRNNKYQDSLQLLTMIFSLCVYTFFVSTTIASPQFVTFKDGKVGVNFGGYAAEAGLGGLLTGNAAHGGLSASARTPHGQNAAAGIGGLVNGNAAGTAYAGAQATDSIGASAIIGGSTGSQQRGLIGAEAHNNGKTATKTITSGTQLDGNISESLPELQVPTELPRKITVQRIKPPKKYTILSNVENPSASQNSDIIITSTRTILKGGHNARSNKRIRPATRRHINLHTRKQILFAPPLSERFGGEEQIKSINNINKSGGNPNIVSEVNASGGQHEQHVVNKEVQLNPGALDQFFNIPIGILQSIRDNLQPIGVQKHVSYSN